MICVSTTTRRWSPRPRATAVPVYVFDPRHYGTADVGGTDSFTDEETGERRESRG